jgi:hypothetical protein
MVDRSPVFNAIRALRAIHAPPVFNQLEVDQIDALLDRLGIGQARPAAAANKQIGLTEADFRSAATKLGCSVAQIKAVWEVESGGGWFTDIRADILALDGPGGFLDGPHLPKILFEAHVFDRETKGKYRASHPNLSSRTWNRRLYVGGEGEYIRLWNAMRLDQTAALRSASVGGAQIMGFNHRLAGYDTVQAFWDAMMVSELNHLIAFCSFIENSKLTAHLKRIDNSPVNARGFANGYNGSGYAANNYHVKIAAAHRKYA